MVILGHLVTLALQVILGHRGMMDHLATLDRVVTQVARVIQVVQGTPDQVAPMDIQDQLVQDTLDQQLPTIVDFRGPIKELLVQDKRILWCLDHP